MSRSVRRSVRVPAPNDDVDAYLDALVGVVERYDIALIVPVSDETMHVGALSDRLPAGVRLFCPPQPSLLDLHDKLAFIRRAEEADLPVPETCAYEDRERARALLARKACISKPRFSSAGKGLRHHPREGSLGADLKAEAPRVLQEYLPGAELSTFAIARDGKVVGNVVYRGLIMSGTVAVSFERLTNPPPAIIHWVRRFAEHTSHNGFLSFDFRLASDGQPLPMECNPRATSGMHFVTPRALATGILRTVSEFPVEWLRSQSRLQQFYTALTEVQAASLRREPVPDGLRLLFSTRDVTWEANDPLPLVLQPAVSIGILARTIFKGWTFGEAATFDIAWGEKG
ncbi:MAG: ATP-grasp domain-containing protein [Pseudomonadota bacterium]